MLEIVIVIIILFIF